MSQGTAAVHVSSAVMVAETAWRSGGPLAFVAYVVTGGTLRITTGDGKSEDVAFEESPERRRVPVETAGLTVDTAGVTVGTLGYNVEPAGASLV